MSAILEQLGLDRTFLYQFAIFMVLFWILTPLYFRPFLRLFQARHKSLVSDREAAEKLLLDADAKFEEYKRRIGEERAQARKSLEAVLAEARKEESEVLAEARATAKKITQEAAEGALSQQEQLKKKLEADVEALARGISEKLLSRRVE